MIPLHRISHDASSILAVALSEDRLYAGTQGHLITVHDTRTFAHVADLCGHNGAVLSLTLSPDGARLFSSAGDSIIRVWCTATLRCLHVVYSRYDVGDVFATAFSSAHDTLYLGSQNTSLQWVAFGLDRPAPDRDAFPTRRPDKFFDSTGPSGRRHLPTDDAGVVDEKEEETLLEIGRDDVVQYAHFSYVHCLLVGTYKGAGVLFSGGGDGAINIWSLAANGRPPQQVRSLCQAQSSAQPVLCLAQQQRQDDDDDDYGNGTLLYAGQARGCVSVWDLETNQLLRRLEAHDAGADVLGLGLCFGSGGRQTLATVGGSALRLWDLSRGVELVDTLPVAHNGRALCCAVSTNGRVLATGGNDSDVALWRLSGTTTTASTATTFDKKDDKDDEDGNSVGDAFMAALRRLVSFRSISNSDEHVEDCRRAASFLRKLASDLGAAEATLLPTAHNPIVVAKFRANTPTTTTTKETKPRSVLYYGHYDVISVNASAWSLPPWELTGRDGFLYGRGVSDNKAPILAALFAAHDLTQTQSLAVDLTLVIEGEEESGSRGFRDAIEGARASGLVGHIDEVFLSNSYWLDDHVPCLTYGLRGVIHATVRVSNALPDVHSGVEGGAVREPTIDLVNLLAKLTDDDTGAIAIPDFDAPVRRVDDVERRFYRDIARTKLLPPKIAGKTPSHKVKEGEQLQYRGEGETNDDQDQEDQDQVVEDLINRWCRPSLTIHKFTLSGPGNSTIIPHSATSNISIRIVPEQSLPSVASSLVDFLTHQFTRFQTPNQLEITIDACSDWWLSDPTSLPFTRLSSLIRDAWGVSPLIIREGGSIPMVRWLERECLATAVHFPMGQSSDSAHLSDERLRIVNLIKGREIMRGYFAL